MDTFLKHVLNSRGLKLATTLLIVGSMLAIAPTSQAAAGDLVITEIMYNPLDDDEATAFDDYEYIELFNPTSVPISLAGMSWDDGVNGSFTAGTIPAGGYAVVSPDPAATQTKYGVSTIATYTGKLSNGGETITLLDTDGVTIIDTVTYDDGGAWPGTPDGNGPSLELVGNGLDNSIAANWLPSITPTPGAANSVVGTLPPVDNLTVDPAAPAPGTPMIVSADIAGSSSATMTYKINVDDGDDNPGTTVAMRDDGVAPDTTAGDGNFAATIPAQSSGTLVRYRVDTGAGDGSPDPIDSITYFGLVVNDPVNTTLPVMRMWMGPNDWTNLDQNHRFDDTYFPAVFEFDGTVYDAVQIRIRGGNWARTNYAKQSYSVEAPGGHDFVLPGYFGYPVDEFAMQSERNWLRAHEGWSTYKSAGFPSVESFHVNVQQNNSFFGIYRVQEKLDGTWRSENELNDGQFFKASGGGFAGDGWDKKDPDDGDYSAIDAFDNLIESPAGANKTRSLYEQIDIPNIINFAAVNGILKNDDIRSHNFYIYYDDSDTERWRIYPWDLDHSFGWAPINCTTSQPAVEPTCMRNPYLDAMWEVPEFRSMYFRRVRTLLDTAFAAPTIENDVAAVLALTGNDDDLDNAKWGHNPTWPDSDIIDDLNLRRSYFNNDSRTPASQPARPAVVINEIHYNGAGADPDFVELYNTTNDWVDLSGWELDGVGLTIAGGTVVEPNGYIVFTDDDVAFRNFYGASTSHVLAQFPGGLSNGGEAIELKNAAGANVDKVVYDDSAPWPTAPDGNGPSLELISPTLNNALAASWAVSTSPAGSPGRANASPPLPDTQAPTVTVTSPASDSSHVGSVAIAGSATDNASIDRITIKIEDLATGANWNATTSSWQNGAFWNVALQPPTGTTDTPFSMTFAPPAPGNFKASVSVTDSAGNTRRPATTRLFTLTSSVADTTKPSLAFDSPFDASTPGSPVEVTSPVVLTGTAQDNVDVSVVYLFVRNRSTGEFWSDQANQWQSNFTANVAAVSANPTPSLGFSMAFPPPEPTGSYIAFAVAFDASSNRSLTSVSYFDRISSPDTVRPDAGWSGALATTSPLSPAILGPTATLTGFGSDDQALDRVVVKIQDQTSGDYWNNATSSWQTAVIWNVVSSASGTNATFSLNVPLAPDRLYRGDVASWDSAGNRNPPPEVTWFSQD